MKNWTKSYLCMIVPIYSENPAFYRQKPRGGRCEKIRGANAPLISTKEPRIHGSGRGSAAWLWPPVHTQAAKTWPKSRFRGFVETIRGAFNPYLCMPLPVGFCL